MRFENPALLNLLWVVPVFGAVLYVYWQWRTRTLRQLGSSQLAERLLLGFSSRRFSLKVVLYSVALALIALCIANPQRAEQVAPPPQKSADIMIALDISQSMLAADEKPSRLESAKAFIQKLVQTLDGDRIGLIFFAGDAYAQMPLSSDHSALLTFVRNANPNFTTEQGTNLASAIELTSRLFGTAEQESGRALVIVSDGENHLGETTRRAREAHAGGLEIHTVSVGTGAGVTIPTGGREVKRDFSGQPVRTAANPALLRDLAQTGGGQSFAASDPSSVRELGAALDRLQQKTVEAKTTTEYVSQYQWLLLPAILLLILEQLLWWKRKTKTDANA